MLGLTNRIVLITLGIAPAASSGRAEVGGKIAGVVKDLIQLYRHTGEML
jgi:hypothetical protein